MKTRWADAHPPRVKTFVCPTCQQTITRIVRKTRDAGQFCSRACAFAAKHAAMLVAQEQRRQQRERIRAEKAQQREEARIIAAYRERRFRACETCGKIMPARGNVRRWCSRVCRNASPDWLELRRQNRRKRGRWHNGNGQHRARARGRQVERGVTPLRILTRDGWRCRVCGCATPSRLRGTCAPNAPEVDHIVPLAMGGGHSWANVQCLCRTCNIEKGAKVRGQFRLAI